MSWYNGDERGVMANTPYERMPVTVVLKPNRTRQWIAFFGILLIFGVGLGGLLLAGFTTKKTNESANDISIVEGDVRILQDRLDDVLLSVVIVDNTTSKKRIIQSDKSSGSNPPPPTTLPLPEGVIAYHTADCYYQDGDPLNLSHLADADTNGASAGNYLAYDGTEWIPVAGPAGVTHLNDLIDVMVPSPSMDEILLFNGANWVNSVVGQSSVDPMQLQYRISGSCPAQSWIRQINQDGTVICDNSLGNNVVGSNQIIDGSINDVDIDSMSVQERINGQCLGDGNYVKAVNQDGSVVCGMLLSPMSVGSSQIIDGSVKKIDIDNSEIQERISGVCSVPGEAIVSISATGTVVCSGVVSALAVDTAQLVDGAVTTAKVDDLAIDTSKIAAFAVTNGKIAPNAVTTTEIASNTILAANVNSGEIQERVVGACVTAGEAITAIASDGTVTCSGAVSNLAVNTNQLVDDSVTSAKLGPGSVDSAALALNSVGSSNIIDNSIVEADMSTSYKRGQPSGVCDLDASGLIPTARLPPLSITSVTVVADIPARDALSPQTGDVCKVTDAGSGTPETYIWDGSTWVSIMTTGDVLSVNSQTGTVVLDTDDVSEGATNKYYSDTLVSANADVVANSAHAALVAGNPHQLDLNDLTNVNAMSPADGQVLAWSNAMMSWELSTLAAAGEVNTASNQNTGGVGVFVQKTSTDLEFRGINAGSSKVSITNDVGNNEIDIDVVEAQINHDSLGGYVANEHIDCSSVTFTAGTGLSGGGNLCASATFDWAADIGDLNDVDTTSTPASTNDVLTWDGMNWIPAAIPGTVPGESNTASNVGAGLGIFKQKIGTDLQFYSLNPGSAKVTILLDVINNEIDIDVVDSQINHNGLSGYVANEHVDCSTVSLIAGTGLLGGGTICNDVTFNLNAIIDNLNDVDTTTSAPSINEVLTWDGSNWVPAVIPAEANTASNQNTAGVGVFVQKTGADLEFRGINAGSAKVTVTNDVGNNEIDIDIVDAQIDHDSLSGYVANEHVDCSTITLIAGTGLSGGGTICNDRTFNLDAEINDLTDVDTTSLAPSANDVLTWDGTKWMAAAAPGSGGGEANTVVNLGSGQGLFKQKVGSDLQFYTIVAASSKLSILVDGINDEVDFDVVEGNINHDSLSGFVANEHVDCSTVNLVAGIGLSGGGTICTDRTFDLSATINDLTDVDTVSTTPNLSDILMWDGSNWVPMPVPATGGGEANTVVNLGAGQPLFKQKVGTDLQFYTIVPVSSKLSISVDGINNEIDIDVEEANINHDALSGYVANEHIDCSSVILTAGVGLTGGGSACASRTFDLSAGINDLTDVDTASSPPTTNDVLTWTGTMWEAAAPPGSGGGEANTIVNLGAGQGIFKQKVGTDLQLYSLIPASNKLSIVLDAINNEIDLDVEEANINHDSLSGYVANEHVDCSTVVLTAGVGLSGGGSVCASRTFDLSATINDLTDVDTASSPPTTNDVLTWTGTMWEAAAPPGSGGGEANTIVNLGAGQGIFKQKVGTDLQLYSLIPASNKLSIVLDAINNEIDLDVVETNINHDLLSGYVANEHVDCSSVTFTAGTGLTGGGNLCSSTTFDWAATINDLGDVDTTSSTPSTNDVLTWDGVNWTPAAAAGAGGEANTASNLGAGQGLFKQKLGTVLQFYSIVPASNKLSIVLDSINNEIDLDVAETNINHDALSGYVANEHIDCTSVVLTAGVGLSGGGDVCSSSTFDLSATINDLTDVDTVSSTPATNDVLTWTGTMWEAAAPPGSGGGEANTIVNLGAGQGIFKQKVGTDLQLYSLIPASNKLSIVLDAINNEIDLDVEESNINHDSLSGYVANEHVDCSTVVLTAGVGLSGGGSVCASRTFDLSASVDDLSDVDTTTLAPTLNDVLTWDGTKWMPASVSGIGGGETNSGVNLGGGQGVFKQKVGVDLQFYSLVPASNKLSISLDAINGEIDLDVAEANINHDALTGYVANEHVDCSSVTLIAGTGLSGGGDVCNDRTFNLNANINDINDVDTTSSAPNTNDVLTWDGSNWVPAIPPGMGGGEANTVSNLGAGQPLYKQKVGVDLQFYSLVPASSKLSISLDAINNEIDLDIQEANINHDALAGYVANEHVACDTVNLIAGTGLSGGGTICNDRTLNLDADIDNLNDVDTTSSAPTTNDVLTWDGTKWMPAAPPGASGGEANTVSNLGSAQPLFKQKVGVDLQFYTINPGSTKFSITLDGINNEIDLDVEEANINHDALSGYVANEHIDCSTISLIPGTGLSGGGDLCNDRTFSLDAEISDLTDVDTTSSAPNTNDVLTWDGSNWVPAAAPGSGGGEANTASNLGAGTAVFKQKVGVDLQFHTLVAASSKMSISLDVPNNEIDFDIVESNINHDALTGYVANEHVDCSSVTFTAGTGLTGGGNLCSSATFDWAADINDLGDVDTTTSTPTTNDVLTWDGSNWVPAVPPGASGGEANTASNQNTGGVGVFIQKVGVDLQFKGIAAASSKLLVTNDMINNKIDIELAEGNVNHNALSMYVANEHVDCTTVTFTAGTGLTGGGNLCSSATFDWAADINDLGDVDTTTMTPSTNDVLTWDGSNWIPATPPGAGGGEANTASNLGTGQGLFSGKVGVDLQFYSLSAASSIISIAAPSMGNVALDVVPGNINHDDLGAIPANDHIDHSTVTLTGSNGITIDGGASGDITTSRTIALSATLSQINDVDNMLAPSNDQILAYDSTSMTWKAGDKVTGSNIGTLGVDVFSAKVADVLQFRRLQSADAAISITQNMNNIDFVINDGSIDHDALSNFVANEHIDHSAISITGAVSGYITGGGDLTASRTLNIDTTLIQRRVTGTCPVGSALRVIDVTGTSPTCQTVNTIVTQDEGVTVAGGPHSTLNFVGAGVTATNAGSGVTTVTIPGGGGGTIPNTQLTATADYTGAGATYGLITGMTTTPAAGTYLVTFSSSCQLSATGNLAQYALFVGGTIVTHSERDAFSNGGGQVNGVNVAMHTQAIVTVNGAQTVEAQALTGGGTFTIHEKSLILLKIA